MEQNTTTRVSWPASLRILLVFWLLLAATFSLAVEPKNSYTASAAMPLIADWDYVEDKEHQHTIISIQELQEEAWTHSGGGSGSFGFSDSEFWLRLALQNQTETTDNFVLEIAYPLLDSVTFYSIREDGSTRELSTGDSKPFYPRDIDDPSMLFRLQLHAGEEAILFAKVSTKGSMILPLNIWTEKDFFEGSAVKQKTHFFYYGALSIIVLINLAVFITLREKLYLFYAAATSGYLLFFWTSRGYSLQLFFPDSPAINTQAFVSSMPILALFSLLFAREFLRTWQHSPKIDRCLKGMIYFEYFNMVAAVVLDYNTAVKISAVSSFFLFGVLFAAGPITWASKRRAGIYFTIAWIPLTIGVAATGGRTSGLLPNNFWTEYAMQIGSGLEAIILTLALAERLYREREKKITAQAHSLTIEKQRHEAQSQLTEAMMRDAVTRLPNRTRFEWMLASTLYREDNDHYIIGVARITRIGEITRTLGLASSERVMRTIAEKISLESSGVPGIMSITAANGLYETAFQLSGDTFGVLIKQSEAKSHEELYRQIMTRLMQAIQVDELSIELAPRFGCAIYPIHGHEPAELIRNAHVAMESAHHKPDQIGWYDNELDIYSRSRLTLMSDLKAALSTDQVTLHYQPKIDLKTSKIASIEALMRWQHPVLGNLPPDNFISLAEETGVIHEVTKWAFSRVAADMITLQALGYEGNIAVNISARDLLNPHLEEHFKSVLDAHKLSANMFYLELTETAAMEDPVAGLQALQVFTDLGLRISIDDFGAGYSSLSYLKSLPATEIKLDRSLICDVMTEENSRVIVKTAIDMAHGLGYQVVAEGVEDEPTFKLLQQLGCDSLQGYWLCRPIPLDAIAEWLKSVPDLKKA
jgi:EAL domain-containing protein (putative c-di-GMP-specific phosphodiesterase class I)/GGDEF domain-containing protein